MRKLELNEQETTQLYVFLTHFANNWRMDTTIFKKDGQARKLASKIAEYLATMDKVTLTH